GGAVDVIVDAILAPNDQAAAIRHRDDAAGCDVLVSMGAVAFAIEERSEPIGDRQRTGASGVPGEFHNAFAQLVEPELRMIGAVAGSHVDVAVVVHGRRRIGHPYSAASAGARAVVGISAPHVSRSAAAGELRGVEGDHPTGGASRPFAAAE